ncbi:MAG: hypothetical protein ACRC46_01820 [Thermoguttaceae bacterium]
MAGNVSFNPKEFLIQHGEKVAIGVVIPIAIFLMSLGFAYSPPTWGPKDLEQVASKADTHITNIERSASDEGVATFEYDRLAQLIKLEGGIRQQPYQTKTLWRPSLFPERQKRTAVEILPVRNLRVTSGVGAIATLPPQLDDSIAPTPGGAGMGAGGMGSSSGSGMSPGGMGGGTAQHKEGKRWALITGLIPIREQFDIYLAAFANATYTDPMRDTPLYTIYNIERCEVTPSGNGPWQTLDAFSVLMKTEVPKWQGMSPEVVDPTFIATRSLLPLAFPLPPVLNRTFGKEATHAPEIPLLLSSVEEEQRLQTEAMKKWKEQQDKLISVDTLRNFNPYTATAQNPTAVLEEEEEIAQVDYYLFRYFDFDVEAGKTYRYRVQLIAANPNVGLAEVAVDDPKIVTATDLTSDWSEPSNAVMVGLDSRILLGSVAAPSLRRPYDDPTGKVTAVYFNLDEGSEWYSGDQTVRRGQVADFKKVKTTNADAASLVSSMTGGSSMMPGGGTRPPAGRGATTAGGRRGTAPATTQDVDVVSGICVLDMLGGNEFPTTKNGNKDLRLPGRMLIVSPSGTIEMRSAIDDDETIDKLKTGGNAASRMGGMSSSMGMGGGM